MTPPTEMLTADYLKTLGGLAVAIWIVIEPFRVLLIKYEKRWPIKTTAAILGAVLAVILAFVLYDTPPTARDIVLAVLNGIVASSIAIAFSVATGEVRKPSLAVSADVAGMVVMRRKFRWFETW